MAEPTDPPVRPVDFELDNRARRLYHEGPEQPEKFIEAAVLWWKAGDLDSAEYSLIEAKRQGLAGTANTLAAFYVANNGWAWAVDRLSLIEDVEPPVLLQIAHIYRRAGMRIEAENYFSRAIDQKVPGSSRGYSSYLLSLGLPKAALEAIEQSNDDPLEDLDQRVACYRAVESLFPPETMLGISGKESLTLAQETVLGLRGKRCLALAQGFAHDPNRYVAYGAFLLEQGEKADALCVYREAFDRGARSAAARVAELDPTNAKTFLRAAWRQGSVTELRALVKLLDAEGSPDAYELLLEGARGKAPELIYDLAARAEAGGDPTTALKWLLHAAHRREPEAHRRLASWYFKAGDEVRAEAHLITGSEYGDWRCDVELAKFYQRQGCEREVYEREGYEQSADLAFSRVLNSSHESEVRPAYVSFLRDCGRAEEAEAMLERAVLSGSVDELKLLGTLYDKQPQKQRDALNKAVDCLVDGALTDLAGLVARQGNHLVAAQLFVRAADAGDPSLLRRASSEFSKAGEIEKADDALIAAVSRNVKYALDACVTSLVKHGRPDEAESLLVEAARENPQRWIEVARLRVNHSPYGATKNAFRRAVTHDPSHVAEMQSFIQTYGPSRSKPLEI